MVKTASNSSPIVLKSTAPVADSTDADCLHEVFGSGNRSEPGTKFYDWLENMENRLLADRQEMILGEATAS